MNLKFTAQRRRSHRMVILAVAIAVAAGCSTAPPLTSNMIPEPITQTLPQPSKSLRVVASVETGQGATMPASGGFVRVTNSAFEPADWARITNSMFREALTETVNQSGLFKSIEGENSTDYELAGTLYTQQVFLSSFRLTATIGIRYNLTALPANKQVWSDNIVSQGSTGQRESDANEIAMRNNLSQLLQRLSKLSLEEGIQQTDHSISKAAPR